MKKDVHNAHCRRKKGSKGTYQYLCISIVFVRLTIFMLIRGEVILLIP